MLRTGELGIPDNPDERFVCHKNPAIWIFCLKFGFVTCRSLFLQIRSPSPEPIYNSEGKRLNTREFRVRKKLEEERHVLIQEAQILNEDYKPPADYKYVVVVTTDRKKNWSIYIFLRHSSKTYTFLRRPSLDF